METAQSLNLYITYVEKEGPFLKVWGQTDKTTSIHVEQFLLGATHQFDQGIGKIPPENLLVGTLACAKYKDNKYYRARITNVNYIQEGFVEVSFLDYGNKDVVPCGNIRSLQSFPPSFISFGPLATGFIFAEAHCPGGGEWNDTVFENISKELRYREVQCTLLTQATQYYLVKLFINGNDLATIFIGRGLMQPISLQAQQAVLLSMSMQRQVMPVIQAPAVTPTEINTYKACTLEPGAQYPVYVSYVNDGPCHFSVQLKQSEELLVKLMNDINAINLKPLEDVPIPGTICLAKCVEDNNICRAVVTNEVDNQFKVFYVDFGNYETIPLDSLYQIPFKYVLPKVMAIRFALHGVEKSTVTLEMQCAFKKFVDNRLLHMKVLPAATRMAIPKCSLWDPQSKTSALDVVNRAATNAYPEPISLNRGFNQLVKVSFVYSCSRFYVQLSSKENELLKLMLDLQASCASNDPMDPSTIKVGLPCCALFESDQQWYRSEIVDVIDEATVKVRYIDYGNEEVVPSVLLKLVEGEQLTVLRPQAIECCLNGYQNMTDDTERDNLLEELILEQQFTMKVVEMMGSKALVELIDSSNYNVASLLLDKIASSKSQVSPMLVQAGNRIEHRKQQMSPREQQGFGNKQDRRPQRDFNNKGWNDRTNDKTTWRQDNRDRDFRSPDSNSNDFQREEKSWRQNNKGFSPNNQRFNRDNNRNKNDWNNKENKSDNVSQASWDDDTTVENNKESWSTPQNDRGFNNNKGFNRDNNKFKKNDRYNDRKEGNWNSGQRDSGFKDDSNNRDGGFRRKDHRREGSEISSSGSEKSFHKGPRTSSRNDNKSKFNKKFDKPRNTSYNGSSVNESWNVSSVTAIDAAPNNASFSPYEVAGTTSKVLISWFHNPGHFYCQLLSVQAQFKQLMEDIQQSYKSRKPEMAVIGAPVIALFPEDHVLYRAKILDTVGLQYKVYYVDFGNVSTVEKVWPIEKKFMTLPAQAICCGLNGAGPPTADWPDADNYSKFFEKESFDCHFIAGDYEKFFVNLTCDNEDVTQILLQNGLLTAQQMPSNDVEIPLLLGQQFRAILKSVNNLSDIIIVLYSGLALTCKMHNLETATETFLDELKNYLEKPVIVYVDNVLEDDKLDVTLYDVEGNKLNIIVPDEGAYDNVESLCPMLVLSSTKWGYVSHVQENSVFLQPIEYADTIVLYLEEMFNYFDEIQQESSIIPEEGLVYAAKSEDGNWYRARVISFDDEKATVTYVDYGNSEDIPFGQLRELTPQFLELNTLAIQITVNAPAAEFLEKDVVASIFWGENGWEGTIQVADHIPQAQTQEVTDNNVPSEETTVPIAQEVTPIPVEAAVSEPQIGTSVIISHTDSPNDFYLQRSEASSFLEELQTNLQEQAPNMPDSDNPAPGVLCAAPYSADQEWYRAQVLDADDDITTVRFIDYGNTDVIDNKTTRVKTLPPNLLSLEHYATRCSLNIKPMEEEWSAAASTRFEELTNEAELSAVFVDQDEKINYVELYSNGQNIMEILITENLALPNEFVSDSKSTCFVSHLNSPSEFWIQLENCIEGLEWIAEQLSGAESFPELEDLTPGNLCAALFLDDEQWYRARILSNTVAGIELLFIDYGNSCMSNSLRQLPEHLVVTPPLAQKCTLQRPDGLTYWTPQAIEKFNEISADGQTIFTVRKISTGETSVVELTLNGEDVAKMLLPVTEECNIKDLESLDSFSVMKNGIVAPQKYKLEALPGCSWSDESLQILKDLNVKGDTLFQVEFISEDTVRIYLKGTDIRPQMGCVKLNQSIVSTEENGEIASKNSSNDDMASKDLSNDEIIVHEPLEESSDSPQAMETITDTASNEKPDMASKDLSNDENEIIVHEPLEESSNSLKGMEKADIPSNFNDSNKTDDSEESIKMVEPVKESDVIEENLPKSPETTESELTISSVEEELPQSPEKSIDTTKSEVMESPVKDEILQSPPKQEVLEDVDEVKLPESPEKLVETTKSEVTTPNKDTSEDIQNVETTDDTLIKSETTESVSTTAEDNLDSALCDNSNVEGNGTISISDNQEVCDTQVKDLTPDSLLEIPLDETKKTTDALKTNPTQEDMQSLCKEIVDSALEKIVSPDSSPQHGKTNYDDTILPATVSRPQSPILVDSD